MPNKNSISLLKRVQTSKAEKIGNANLLAAINTEWYQISAKYQL